MIYNDNDYFPFETYYAYIEYDNGLISIDTPKLDNSYKLIFIAKGPSFDIVSNALEEATYINHITGQPFVVTSILYKKLFSNVVINVQFPNNDKLESIDISQVDMNKLHYNLIKIVMKEWLKKAL